MTPPYDVAIVGAGMMGAIHAHAWQATGHGRVRFVVDRDESVAQRLAERLGAVATSNAAEAAKSVQVASVCTPPADHPATVETFAACGIHVLLEKPSAVSLAAHDAMAQSVADAGVLVMVGTTTRFYPESVEAKQWLDTHPGRIVAMRERVRIDDRPLPAWYLDPRIAGGGVLLTNGIHAVDRMLWLTGARTASVRSVVLVDEPYRERIADVALWLDAGIPAHLQFVWQHDVATAATLEIVRPDVTLELEAWQGLRIHGDEGGTHASYATTMTFDERTQVGIEAEVRAFASAIAAGRTPPSSLAEHRMALAIVMDAYEVAERSVDHVH